MTQDGQASQNAFGRAARLHCQSQFTLVRGSGVSSAGRYCVVNILMPSPDQSRRAAFCISRKFSPLAVERNRARRLFREVYAVLQPELPPSWVLFIPRKHMKSAKMADVLGDVRGNLERCGVRCRLEVER